MKITGIIAMWRNRAQREKLYSTAEYWDAKASELEGDAISMWPNNMLNALYHKEQMDLVVDAIGSLHGKKVLDVGCGTGRLSRFFADCGATVVGIDFSGKAISIAQQKAPSGNPVFRELSVFNVNEVDEYDFIFSWGCVVMAATTRNELLAAMQFLRRASKPNADALFLEPVHRGFVHRVLDMDVDEFCEVMQEAGFQIEWIRQMHFWPMRFVLAFISWPRWVTAPCYYFGQRLMRLPGFRGMGDYKAIKAIAV